MTTMVSDYYRDLMCFELTVFADSLCSKMGENRLHSANAYLLFYRRRSEKPLGPQYLQDLVSEARNPQPAESANDETAEESDSGEGRLGGPNGSLLGSSSALTGAGVAAGNRHAEDGGTGARQAAGNSLTTRTTVNEVNGLPVYGPERPPHLLEYGNQGTSWNFDSLGADVTMEAEADNAAGMPVDKVDSDDDDAGSTKAEVDNDGANGFDSRMEEDFGEFADAPDYNSNMMSWSAGQTTPVDSSFEWEDSAFSNAHEQQSTGFNTLHLEDTSIAGDDELPSVNIYPDPPTAGRLD